VGTISKLFQVRQKSTKRLANSGSFRYIVAINAERNDKQKASVAHIGGTLAESANVTRGSGAPTPDHDAYQPARASRIKAEQSRLIEWAKKRDKLGSGRLPPEFTRGGEHQVFFQKRTRRYVKVTLPDKHKGYGIALGSFTHGATPAEYLDRLDLQNRIFNDDIRLERVIVKNNFPLIVISQPAIKGMPPTQTGIDEMMATKGFEKLISGAYYDSENGFLVFDLFPKNAMQAADGVIYPFDPVIQRITPDFADFLRSDPERIHNR
jgi:serine/threonin/tyrosin kinase-like protein